MAIPSFLDYLLLEKNYSKLTIKAYNSDLIEFQDFLKSEYQIDAMDSINYAMVRSWIVTLVEKGITNRTINRKMTSLNSYYKFLLKIGQIATNPLAKHKALKTSKKMQIPFSEKEVTAVLDEWHFDNSFEGVRDKLIIELFYSIYK